ncbi:solute carrier family 22 member 7-like [Haemaphysalis longicornis]
MPQSPPTDQLASTPSGRPRPDAALLTGSGWAEPRTAIQESVYAILGHGHFQRRVLFTGMLSSAVLVMQALAYQLICREVPHWCAPPDNLRYLPPDAWRNAAIPLQADGSYSQCTVYEPPVPVNPEEERRVVSCDRWNYDADYVADSIVSNWDMVCDRRWLQKLARITYLLGATLFVPAVGFASDRAGRRPTILASVVVLLAGSVGAAVSQTLTVFLVTRFFVSASSCSLQVLVFILIYEVTGNDRRGLFGVLATALGTTLVPPLVHTLALLEPHWYLAHSFLLLPTAMLAFWCYLLDESPLWLLATWRTREAEQVILFAASQNAIDLDKARATFKAFKQQLKRCEQTPLSSMVTTTDEHFWNATYRNRALSVMIAWFSANFIYYGQLLRHVDAEGIWRALLVAVQSVLYAAVWHVLQYRGQRQTLFILLVSACVLSAAQSFLLLVGWSLVLQWVDVGAASLGPVVLSVTYGYTAEVFPTGIRSWGLGLSFTVGRIGVLAVWGLLFVVEGRVHVTFSGVVAVLALLSGVAIQWLPEIFVEKRKRERPRQKHRSEG